MKMCKGPTSALLEGMAAASAAGSASPGPFSASRPGARMQRQQRCHRRQPQARLQAPWKLQGQLREPWQPLLAQS